MGFPDGSDSKASACNVGDPGFNPWVGKIPWRRKWQPTPIFLDFPCGSAGKESVCNAGDPALTPGSGRSSGGGYGNYGDSDSSVSKESACNAGDPSSIPGLGRSAGEGIRYPFQYSWASLVAQLIKNLPATWETWVRSLGWEDHLEKGTATNSVLWPGEFLGQRSLAGYSP